MTTRSINWSPRAQAWRVIAQDARVTGADVLYSAAYVLAAFYVPPPNLTPVHTVLAPFFVLAMIQAYLVDRACGGERGSSTAMFYANLPRSRSVGFWAHTLWLGALTLGLEAVICCGMALRLGAASPEQVFTTLPCMYVLPFLAQAVFTWTARGGMRHLFTAVFFSVGMWMWLFTGQHLQPNVISNDHVAPALQSATSLMIPTVATVGLIWLCYRQWTKTQIGEVA